MMARRFTLSTSTVWAAWHQETCEEEENGQNPSECPPARHSLHVSTQTCHISTVFVPDRLHDGAMHSQTGPLLLATESLQRWEQVHAEHTGCVRVWRCLWECSASYNVPLHDLFVDGLGSYSMLPECVSPGGGWWFWPDHAFKPESSGASEGHLVLFHPLPHLLHPHKQILKRNRLRVRLIYFKDVIILKEILLSKQKFHLNRCTSIETIKF